MGITFTRKGYIQVIRDGVVLSEHVEERKAVQSLSEREDGDYVLRYPDVAVTVILRKSDTTPPAVPSGFSASAATATSVTLTLTANVESDFSNYVLERSSDNIGWGYLKSFTGTSTTDTVDVSGSTYYYRAFAIDTRGNRSAYTAVKSAGPYTVAFSWNGTIPNVTFNRGNAQNFDLSPYIIGSSPVITVETGTLPAGVTLNSSLQRLQYDGSSATSTAIVATGISLKLSSASAADWQSRISTSGVVWYHDFSSSNEVRNFRWTGGVGLDVNDSGSQDVQYDATDGITGGCLKLISPASPSNDDSGWWRPFSPLVGGTTTGNGRGVNDPGNGITPRAWDTTNTNTTANHTVGYYGDPLYQTADFDGTDYWLQVRCKMSPEWWTQPVQDRTGKFLYLTSTKRSLTNQEIVTNAPSQSVAGVGGTGGSFYMYRSGSPPLQDDWIADGGADLSQVMPGGTCNFGTNPGSCWVFPPNEWVTLLYHVVLGRSEDGDTFIEVWGAHSGHTSYTKIWEQTGIPLPYDSDIPKGHNAILLSPGANEVRSGTITADMVMKVGQIIFMKGNGTSGTPLIACPQDAP